jgi:hypothetical protein
MRFYEATDVESYELPDFDTHSNCNASRIFHVVDNSMILIERADGKGWMLADAWPQMSDMCYTVISPIDLEPFDGNPFQGSVGDAMIWAGEEIPRFKQVMAARQRRHEERRTSAK